MELEVLLYLNKHKSGINLIDLDPILKEYEKAHRCETITQILNEMDAQGLIHHHYCPEYDPPSGYSMKFIAAHWKGYIKQGGIDYLAQISRDANQDALTTNVRNTNKNVVVSIWVNVVVAAVACSATVRTCQINADETTRLSLKDKTDSVISQQSILLRQKDSIQKIAFEKIDSLRRKADSLQNALRIRNASGK